MQQDDTLGNMSNSCETPVEPTANSSHKHKDSSSDDDETLIEGVIVNNKVLINGHIICDLLCSDNLNECVESLLKKQKPQRTDAYGVVLPQVMVRPKNSLRNRGKLRRIRKNTDQYKILNSEYLKSNYWSKEHIRRLSKRLGLKQSQIYKWNWDQRKKDGLVRTEEEDEI